MRAATTKEEKGKLEIVNGRIYQVIARYIEVDEKPYVLELIRCLDGSLKKNLRTMKEHTLIDASMLDKLEHYKDEKMIKIAYQICRWHHERYDGKGYPDGLIGEQIPIAAQVVSVADVYDALVSKRVYKDAYSHEQAMKMILNGECGAFNPLLMEVLVEIQDKIKEEIRYEA